MNRRGLLTACGAIATGLVAGCLGDELTEANPEGDDEADSDAGDEDVFDGVEPGHGDGFLEGRYAVDGGEIPVKQVGFNSGRWWDESRDGSFYPSRVELFATEDAVLDFIDFDAIHSDADHRDEVKESVEDTDFEAERLLFVGTGGPNFAYTHVLITDFSIGVERITGEAAAYAEEDPVSEAPNSPEALVRIAFDNAPRDKAGVTDVTGGEREHVGGGREDEHTAEIEEN